MKKLFFITLAAISTLAYADRVEMAKVVNIIPLERNVEYLSREQRCSYSRVPIYKTSPVTQRVYVDGNPAAGVLVGAAVGHVLSGDPVGALIGGMIGANHARSRVEERIVGYDNVLVGYRDEPRCYEESVFRTRTEVYAYEVTYELNDKKSTTRMNYRPSSHVRIITSVRVE